MKRCVAIARENTIIPDDVGWAEAFMKRVIGANFPRAKEARV
jgi:hypothetical protein